MDSLHKALRVNLPHDLTTFICVSCRKETSFQAQFELCAARLVHKISTSLHSNELLFTKRCICESVGKTQATTLRTFIRVKCIDI